MYDTDRVVQNTVQRTRMTQIRNDGKVELVKMRCDGSGRFDLIGLSCVANYCPDQISSFQSVSEYPEAHMSGNPGDLSDVIVC